MPAPTPKLTTVTSVGFDLVNPTPEMFRLHDIATALSRLCRFNGHINAGEDDIYSVAQHSCYVHDFLAARRPEARFWGLMHDGPEAFYGDNITPIKQLFPMLAHVEDRAAAAMREAFSVPYNRSIAEVVHWADQQLCIAESFALRSQSDARTMMGVEFPHYPIRMIDPDFCCWTPSEAQRQFKRRFISARKATIEQPQ